jgi:hypothetical protein
MQVAFGISLGVAAVETLLLVGVAFIVVTGENMDGWKAHRKLTTDRIRAWKINWSNGADHEEAEADSD